MKRLLILLMIAMMSISMIAYGEETTLAETTEEDYTYLDDMSINQLKALDAEIHKRLPVNSQEDVQEEENNAALVKEEMLSISQPLTRDEIEESLGNILFAKSLIGNVYTFGGTVESIKEDHAVITFLVVNENGSYGTNTMTMVANLYLTFDELISIEEGQCLNFVGELTDASNSEESIPDWGKVEIVNMEFKNAAIVSDRFEATGKLHSRNASYGKDAWNIEYDNNPYLSVFHFRDDVSSYQGQKITFSYKDTSEGNCDAIIIEE